MAVTMKQMSVLVATLGIVSFVLGVIAENKKVPIFIIAFFLHNFGVVLFISSDLLLLSFASFFSAINYLFAYVFYVWNKQNFILNGLITSLAIRVGFDLNCSSLNLILDSMNQV